MTNNEKYIKTIRKRVGKAINRYNLIEADDKVVVALSSGKDSLLLLETLAQRRKYIPIHYELLAVHINVKNITYDVDRDYLQAFCDQLQVPLRIKSVTADIKDNGKNLCFSCSWSRRKELFQISKDLNYNKLAFGHNQDDSLETLLLNMVFHGEISAIPPKLSMFNGRLHMIRPLIFLTEKEILDYVNIRQWQAQKNNCPYGDDTKRYQMKQIISQLENLTDQAKKNLYQSMFNICYDYVPSHD